MNNSHKNLHPNIICWALLLIYLFLETVYFKPFNLNSHYYTCCCHKKGWANGEHAGTERVTEQLLVSIDSLTWFMLIKNVKFDFYFRSSGVNMFCELSEITGVDMKHWTTRRLRFHHWSFITVHTNHMNDFKTGTWLMFRWCFLNHMFTKKEY